MVTKWRDIPDKISTERREQLRAEAAEMARYVKPLPFWIVFPPLFVFVYLTHYTLLRLPYYWDEAGYYIPAAYDFFRTHALIPYSTLSNAHPPLPSVLLAAWWHLSGFVPSGTRTLCCIVTALALTAVYRIAEKTVGQLGAVAVTLLTALYPVWFAQSTLAHADIFAAAFTLWAIALFLELDTQSSTTKLAAMTFCCWLAVLSKETAIMTPFILAGVLCLRRRELVRILALLSSALPLLIWFAYHRHVTGFAFGNPEYLHYNATANLGVHRIAFALFHRAIHLTAHMNLFVPVMCAVATLFLPLREKTPALPANDLCTFAALLCGYWLFFSVMGGALLTRYLLPAYPLVMLLCVLAWQRHLRTWWPMAVLAAAAFVSGLFVNPPYHFAPEDNLAYSDLIRLQQDATAFILQRWPDATVLTAWPMSDELRKPELGYVAKPVPVVAIDNFSLEPMQRAAAEENTFDTALVFSTKYDPPRMRAHQIMLGGQYFDYHRDLSPAEAARLLHGSVMWQQERNGLWAAVIRMDHGSLARLEPAPIIINR